MARSRNISKKVNQLESDAAYYQAHKDDPDEWGGTEPGPKAPQRLEVVVSVRLSVDEEVVLRRESAKRGQTLSSFIRGAALERCRAEGQVPVTIAFQAMSWTQPVAGGHIAFPGGTLQLTGKALIAEAR